MAKIELLEKYAKLVVEVGANVQKNQLVAVNSSTETKELARLIVSAAYKAGAKRVVVQWSDAYVSRSGYDSMSIDTLQEIPEWTIEQAKYFIKEN